MIHSPSWFTARMKESRNWPSGRKDAKPCSEGLAPASPSSSCAGAEEQLEERTPLAAAMLLGCAPELGCAAGAIAGAAKGNTPGDRGTAGPVRRKPSPSGWARSGGGSGRAPGGHPPGLGVSHWEKLGPKSGDDGLDGETNAGAALGWAVSACRNPAAGRPRVSWLRKVSRTKSCSQAAWRKRTSVLAGWTLTSTSSGGISTNSSTTGNDVGARILR